MNIKGYDDSTHDGLPAKPQPKARVWRKPKPGREKFVYDRIVSEAEARMLNRGGYKA